MLGHMQRASGDSRRAIDTYVEALNLNPYMWEAFDGLIELGPGDRSRALTCRGLITCLQLFQTKFDHAGSSRSNTDDQYRLFTAHVQVFRHRDIGSSWCDRDIPADFQLGKVNLIFLIPIQSSHNTQVVNPFYHLLTTRTPTIQTVPSSSLLGPETPIIQTPVEPMKPQRPQSRSMGETLKGKTALRSVRETIQV